MRNIAGVSISRSCDRGGIMKPDAAALFGDFRAILEDVHGIAVEGQRADNSADMEHVLATQLRGGIASLTTTLCRIRVALESAPQ